jgi:hypothetical protein
MRTLASEPALGFVPPAGGFVDFEVSDVDVSDLAGEGSSSPPQPGTKNPRHALRSSAATGRLVMIVLRIPLPPVAWMRPGSRPPGARRSLAAAWYCS